MASIDDVWKAVTDKDHMKKWYFDLKEFVPEVGFKFQFVGGPENGTQYVHLCEITTVIPGQKISYAWRYEGYQGHSVVTFELEAHDHRTKVKLTHEGLDSFSSDIADFARKNFEAGWNHLIGTSLKNYLEK